MPKDFGSIAVDDLRGEPFSFKQFHVQKVAKARKKEGAKEVDTVGTPTTSGNLRGRCSVCNKDVFDTQPRRKDAKTNQYKHEACLVTNDAARSDARASIVDTAQSDAAAFLAAAKDRDGNYVDTVAVTGASGFIAIETIKQLLTKGYHVKGTIRRIPEPGTEYTDKK